jgi:hypothetical protein
MVPGAGRFHPGPTLYIEKVNLFARFSAGARDMFRVSLKTSGFISKRPLTISECAAKTLLAAWTSRDLLRLRSALAQTDAVSSGNLPAFEQERFELLQEIAGRMRMWIERPQHVADYNSEELAASLGLLGHLAGSGPGRATAAPQFEMRVCVRY